MHDPHGLHWNWAVYILVCLAAVSALYVIGLMRLWRRAGRGNAVSYRQAASYGCGIGALFIALISPIDTLSGELFSVHMLQHMILMMVAAPLLVMGSPAFVIFWTLPRHVRQRVARWWGRADSWQTAWQMLSQPVLVWLLYALILWAWHVPALYQAALKSQVVHDIQHLGFLTGSALFWWIVLDPSGRLRLSRGVGVLYVFTTSLHAGALGVFITLSPRAWYPYYEGLTTAWNLNLLEDQQLAGIIMWMPACLLYVGLAAAIFALWMREMEADTHRVERFAALQQDRRPERHARRRLIESEGGTSV